MRELTSSVPKPMIEVRGKPILLHIIEGLQQAGVTNLLIVVGYKAKTIEQYFADGQRFGLRVGYVVQTVQDGTGRVIELARSFVGADPFLLHYGDILVDAPNYPLLVSLKDEVEAIVSVRANEDCSKGGAVFVDREMMVTDVREKPLPGEPTSHWYNAGVYAFRPAIFEWTAKLQPSVRGEYELTDAVRELARSGARVQALELSGAWADVRDPEILAQLNER